MTMDLAARENGAAIEVARPSSGLALTFSEMTMRVAQVDQFYREVMQEGTDYGKIPGTDKPTLYQPGAQMLDQIFGYSPRFEVLPSSVIAWDRPIPFFHYVVRCYLVSLRSGSTVAEGIGSCNSYEDKYRWRNAKRVCPGCKAEAIIKGKQEFGGGWICFKKNGGCGAKFRDGEAVIEGQAVGRVENEDSASLENTISKMAQKRAHIAATLNATGASRIFTQDIEDLPQFQQAMQATVVESSSAAVPPDAPAPVDADAVPPWVATYHEQWARGAAMAREIGAPIPEKVDVSKGKDACQAAIGVLKAGIDAHRATLDATRDAADGAKATPAQPADAEARAKFEANWAKGVARAVACGIAPEDRPGPNATTADLNRAQRELLDAIVAREKLNDALIGLVNEIRSLGVDYGDLEPSRMTSAEVHDGLARLAEQVAETRAATEPS